MEFLLDDQLLEPISKEISRAFDLSAFKRVVWNATRRGLFAEFVGPGNSLRVTAFDFLLFMNKHEPDLLPLFFACALNEKPDATDLRTLVEKACPDIGEVKLDPEEQVLTVINGLKEFLLYITDPGNQGVELISHLKASKETLSNTKEEIEKLEFYKILHDGLHEIHLTPNAKRKATARELADSRDHRQDLRDDVWRIKTAVKKLETALKDCHFQDRTIRTESRWIKKLSIIQSELDDAYKNKDSATATHAYLKLQSILQFDLKRINELIFDIASYLPISDLNEALLKMSEATSSGNSPATIAGVKTARNSLRDLGVTIFGRVNQHNVWQEADDDSQQLESLFEDNPKEAFNTFSKLWPKMKSQVNELLGPDANEESATQIREGMDSVSDTMAELLDVFDDANTDAADDTLEDEFTRLGDVFTDYNYSVRWRFKEIDAKLKNDCNHLAKIGWPIQQMLEVADV